ncbi:hypothetical protein RYX36_005571, partial [Vicia faba]
MVGKSLLIKKVVGILLGLLGNNVRELIFCEGIIGGWNSIENIKDPHVSEIAQFAATEQQKQSGVKLSLMKVINGETQIVAGVNYRLVLTANNGSVTKKYQAQVVDVVQSRYPKINVKMDFHIT